MVYQDVLEIGVQLFCVFGENFSTGLQVLDHFSAILYLVAKLFLLTALFQQNLLVLLRNRLNIQQQVLLAVDLLLQISL